MIRHTLASAAALFTLVATPAAAAAPLQPNEKWSVDFGDAHCIATRSFGPASAPVTLAIKPAPIGDMTQVTVVHPMRSTEMSQYRGTMSFDQAAPVPLSLVGYPASDGKMRVTAATLPRPLYDSLRGASVLTLSSPGEIDASFALSQMPGVAHALDRCIVDLQEVWHIGPAAAKLRQPAAPVQPLNALFSADDYPRVAFRSGGTGRVGVTLLINEQGRIASCGVTETSGVASLDLQTCLILTRRSHFTPALGLDGKPTKGGYSQRVAWRKPS